MVIVKLNRESLNNAEKVLKSGGVVIFPTDTVYGFLAVAGNKKAVEKIYKIKNRLKSKPLPVFVKDLANAKKISVISLEQEKYIKKFWPGSTTFVLNRKIIGLTKLFGQDKKTIAIRAPRHKLLLQLLDRIKGPVVQTSVNISGKKPFNKIEDIYNFFKEQKNQPDLIVDAGNLPKRKPSSIIDFTRDKIKILRK